MKYTVYANKLDDKGRHKTSIDAAEDDEFDDEPMGGFDDEMGPDEDDFDMEDEYEDEPEEDEEEAIDEDQPNIETDNNISGRYIAECDSCHGIFISAVSESDTRIDCISGICPLCNKQTNQYLKWIINDVEDQQ